jgi:hypothetical protein
MQNLIWVRMKNSELVATHKNNITIYFRSKGVATPLLRKYIVILQKTYEGIIFLTTESKI